MTIYFGYVVANTKDQSWNYTKKALCICWCAVVDVCVTALCMV